MHIALDDPQANALRALRMTHRGEHLVWSVSEYDRSKFNNLNGLFDEINAFWEQCRKETQDAIWSCFKEIYHDLNMIEEPSQLQKTLTEKVTQIYELMPYEDVRRWSFLYGNIQIPSNIKKEYNAGDLKQRTYLRDDYYDLVVFSIALKPMLPIFGEYLFRIKPVIGTNFKEKMALNLLSRSSMVKSAPWQRLCDYIDASIENETLASSAILGGLGTAELPGWLLSKAIVRRVVIGEAGVVNDNSSIISNVHHSVTANLRSMDRNFNGRVNDKNRPRGDGEEDNMSYAETYKVKQQISDGDLGILSVYTEQVKDMVERVDPTIDHAKLDACYKAVMDNAYINISQHHLTLTQWVLSQAQPLRGIPSVNKPALLRSIAATQALLWHWGFHELALLMLAEEVIGDDPSLIASIEDPKNLSADMVNRLVEIYPHYQRLGSTNQRPRKVNVGCRAIDALVREMTKTDWRLNGPQPLLDTTTGISGDRVMTIPPNMRFQLAELLIHLAP